MQMSKSGRQFTALGIIAALTVWCAPANANESVRAELTRLQKQKGLSLVALATAAEPGGNAPRNRESIDTVVFGRQSLSSGKQLLPPDARISDKGSISPDGSEIALSFRSDPGNPKSDGIVTILGRDGHLVRSYPCLLGGSDFCWSPDSSKLVLRAIDKRVDPCNGTLQVLDLKTGITEKVDSNDDIYVTSQCWSPDEKHFVYTSRHFNNREIRRYDEDQKTSVSLEGEGWGATWSPDGKWISFFVGDGEYAAGGTFYVVSPSGAGEKRALFHQKYAIGPLWWSPDSRFVAYVTWAGLLERFAMGPKYVPSVLGDLITLDLGNGPMRLRVRRIDDGSDTPVFTIETGTTTYNGREFGTHGPSEFQWLTGINLPSD
jgi:Tol biopolymer transport system component